MPTAVGRHRLKKILCPRHPISRRCASLKYNTMKNTLTNYMKYRQRGGIRTRIPIWELTNLIYTPPKQKIMECRYNLLRSPSVVISSRPTAQPLAIIFLTLTVIRIAFLFQFLPNHILQSRALMLIVSHNEHIHHLHLSV